MFDPYHKWLGIPPGPRPPTHYQLLGINPSEQDRDVIEAAAVRQTAYVRNFQSGPHGKECARILGELAKARITLLDPAKRASYDAQLPEPEPAPAPISPSATAPAVATLTGRAETATAQVPVVTTDAATTSALVGRPPTRGAFARTLTHLAITACALAGVAFLAIKVAHRPSADGSAPVTASTKATTPGVAAPRPTDPAASAPRVSPGTSARGPSPRTPDATAIFDVKLPEGANLKVEGMPCRIILEGDRRKIEFPSPDGATAARLLVSMPGYEPFQCPLTPKPGDRRVFRPNLVPVRVAEKAPDTPAEAPETVGKAPAVEVETSAAPHPEPEILQPTLHFEGNLDEIRCVAYHPEGVRVAAGDKDSFVRVWLRSGRISRRFQGHVGPINAVAFGPDGRRLLSGGQDGSVRLWDLKLNRGAFVSKGDQHEVRFVAILPGENHILVLTSDRVSVLEGPAWKVVRGFQTNAPGRVLCMAVSAKSNKVLMGDDSGGLRLWNPDSGQDLPITFPSAGRSRPPADRAGIGFVGAPPQETFHVGEVAAVAFAPDGEHALSAGSDRSLRFWDFGPSLTFRGPAETRLWRRDAGRITCLAFSPDGRRALSGGDRVRLWDVAKGYETHVLKGHSDDVTALAFSPDGRHALTGGLDKALLLWDLPEPEAADSGASKAAPN